MREILFRGQIIVTREWVYGCYFQDILPLRMLCF